MRLRILLPLVLAATSLHAQSTQAAIEARLVHQPLYLRGFWHDDKLKFDSSGTLRGSSSPTSFTVCGVDISRVKLTRDHLELDGPRIGLTFAYYKPLRVVLRQGKQGDEHDAAVHLEIAAPASGDYTAALDAIFARLDELAPMLPEWWQRYASKYLVVDSAPQPVLPSVHVTDSPRRIGGGVAPPRVLDAPEPQFSEYARAVKLSGNVLVYLQVDTDGKPIKVSILRPLGLGLDERAVAAVQGYRFAPAMEGGHPVRVEMNVEVNFQIF